MLKHIWLCAACFVSGPLLAETVGNVEFQFPPSNYEWRLFVDDTFFSTATLFDDDDQDDNQFETSVDYQWGTPILDDEDDSDEQMHFKMFTHREGDALEIFVAYHVENPDGDNEEDELGMLEVLQKDLDESVNKYLPNHRIKLNAASDNGTESFADWELNDGIQDIMHGYNRARIVRENGVVKSVTMLGYFTTAARTEYNRMIWADVLNQAKILN